MSALTDLFEGNFNQLGGDFTSPSAITEFEDTGIGLGALALGGLGLGALGAFGAADVGAGAAGAGLADIGVGAAGDLGASAADVGAGSLGADAALTTDAGAALGAADTGAAVAGGGADPLAAAEAFSPAASDPLAAIPNVDSPSFDLGQTGTNWFNTDPSIQGYTAPDASAGTVSTTPGTTGGTATGLPTGPTVNASTTGAVAPGATSGGTVTGMGGAAPATGATGTLNSILSSPWTKIAAGAIPLALTLGMGEQQLPASAIALQGQAAALQQQGLTNLAQAQAGVLNAGQTAQIGTMQQNLTNQWLQTLKNQGVQDPTKDARWPQIQAAIDQQVTSATADLIQQNIGNALAETGQASAALTSIAQMQMTADQNFTNNLINATKSLGLAAGSSALPKITIGS